MESSIELLKRLLAEGKEFTFENFCYPHPSGQIYGGEDKPAWMAWKTRSNNIVRKLMDEDSPSWNLAKEAMEIRTMGNYVDKFQRVQSNFMTALQMTLNAFEEDTFGEIRAAKSASKSAALSNKVFVVHGHDGALKTDIERFIHQIGLEPVVLHRQPDKGQTIIEKFEENSDVGYAFILLTPDEFPRHCPRPHPARSGIFAATRDWPGQK